MLGKLLDRIPMIKKRRFPVLTTIFEKRANGYFIEDNRARRTLDKEDKTEYYELMTGERIEAQKFEDIFFSNNGGNELFMYSPNSNEYYPMNVDFDGKEANFKPVDSNMKLLLALSTRKAFERWNKPSWIEKYMPFILIIGTGMVISIMFWVVLRNLGQFASAMGNLGQMAQALREWTAVMQEFMKTTGYKPIPVPSGVPG